MKTAIILGVVTAVLIAAPASAQTATDHAAHHPDASAAKAATPSSDGEVKKVDKRAGKVTIAHGEIPNLEMPAMTMVFRVKDTALLDRLKEGDTIRFTADKVNGIYTITTAEVVKR